MGLILASFFVVPALVGWAAVRYSRARRYPYAGLVRVATWLLGVAACLLAAWFLGRADEYISEGVISGVGLGLTVALLWWLRAHAPSTPESERA
jgi:hypothetical protein